MYDDWIIPFVKHWKAHRKVLACPSFNLGRRDTCKTLESHYCAYCGNDGHGLVDCSRSKVNWATFDGIRIGEVISRRPHCEVRMTSIGLIAKCIETAQPEREAENVRAFYKDVVFAEQPVDVLYTDTHVVILYERRMTLDEWMATHFDRKPMVQEIIKLVSRFHTFTGMAHGDLTPSSIVIKDGVPLLTGFGISERITNKHAYGPWTPPEGPKTLFKSDYWSLGLLVRYVLMGALPVNWQPFDTDEGLYDVICSGMHPYAADLIKSLMSVHGFRELPERHLFYTDPWYWIEHAQGSDDRQTTWTFSGTKCTSRQVITALRSRVKTNVMKRQVLKELESNCPDLMLSLQHE